MATLTNLDPDCICGMSSRCQIHKEDEKALRIFVTFNVCKDHHRGLCIDTTRLEIRESTYRTKPNICMVGACSKKGYAAYQVAIDGKYCPE